MGTGAEDRTIKYVKDGVWGTGTILDRLTEAVNEFPDRYAYVDPPNRMELSGHEPESVTYKELQEITDAVATYLIEAGLEKGDKIIVQLPNVWELPMLYFAICKAGGIISPIPTQWREKELSHVLEKTGAIFFISIDSFQGFNHLEMGRKFQANFPDLKLLSLDDIRQAVKSEVNHEKLEEIGVIPSDVWTLQWSSGTEAEPKACPRTHDNWYYCYEGKFLLDIDKQGCKNFLIPAQIVNNTGITYSIVLPLVSKGTSVLHHPFDFGIWLQQMEEEKIDFAGLVPAMLNAVLKHPDSESIKFNYLKVAITGSAPPSNWALQTFKERYNVDMVNVWGQNEGPTIHSGPLTTPLEKRMFFPQFGKKNHDWGLNNAYIESIETKIVCPETGNELTEFGDIGELVWKGPEMISGYYNAPELNEGLFDEEGFIRTGDLFKIEDDNYISYFDRKKDIINRGGVNISAQEVENIALKHPDVKDAAAVPMPDETIGEKVCLYVVKGEDSALDLEEIKNLFESESVAKYKWPERLEFVDVIPRNPIGKVVKKLLKDDIAAKMS